ncbi:hypothetical protein LZZ85_11495 [Terrimonas sp. NA20]|uniref:Sialate O-acetylesterase domain-containing protein n=1 Tax=Terrimonas ginsenosidimutans TaxID=2908004 RepID=A0ABS9KRF1_9BACT|nr:hypothetical protein [Terrimonas ginsenosidimutans]MCG2614913.1 hypothetical protein [Terrimonas ginsenosidimutans]
MKRIFLVLAIIWPVALFAQVKDTIIKQDGYKIPVNDIPSDGRDSSALISSRAVYDDLQNVYDTRGKFLNVARKLLVGSSQSGLNTSRGDVRFVLGWIGDSMSGYIASPFYNMLKDLLGFGGGNMESVTPTGGGSIHQNVAETQYWFNGTWYEINGSGSLEFLYAGARVDATKLKVYYIQEPGAGSFQVQVNAGAGFVNEGSVVDCNGTLEGKIITINKAQGDYSIKINQVSGNVKIVMCAAINEPTGSDAVMLYRMGVGGLQWTNANATSKAITSPIFADMGIDLAMIQIKEDGDVYPDLKQWLDAFRLASPRTDWSLNGSGPETSNDLVNRATNRAMKRIALEDTLYYLDGYSPLISMARVDSLGWKNDGVHLDNATGHYLASMLWRIIGIEDYYAIGRKLGVDKNGNLKVLNNRAIRFETTDNNGTAAAFIRPVSRDLAFWFDRWASFYNITGTTLYTYFDPNAGWKIANNLYQRGYTFDITNAAGMYMPNDSTIAMFRNRGAGTRMHFWGQNGSFLGSLAAGGTFSLGSLPIYSAGGYVPLGRNTTTNVIEAITFSPPTTTSAASALTLSVAPNGESDYIHNGTGAIWTLPPVPAAGSKLVLHNATNYIVVVNSNAGVNDIVNGSSLMNTLSISAQSRITLLSNGSYWYVDSPFNIITQTSVLDFPSISTGTSEDLTMTVSGVALGDNVLVTKQGGFPYSGAIITAWGSGTNTVTIRILNVSGSPIDPAADNYKVKVIK